MEIPEHVLKNGPWSISKAGIIQKCALQFDFKYGAQKQKELVQYPESRLGVAVHTALELALDRVPTKQAFTMSADRHQLTTDEAERLYSYFDQVDRFAKKMEAFQARHGVTRQNVFREHKLGVSPDFKHVQFYDDAGLFRGVVDYAMLTANNDLVIIDHKSGKQKDMSHYEDQCKAYCILALGLFPNLKGVQTAINFIQTDKLEWNPRVTAETIRTEYQPWLVAHLIQSCTKLLGPPDPAEGWWCGWCGYKPICPRFAANATGKKE